MSKKWILHSSFPFEQAQITSPPPPCPAVNIKIFRLIWCLFFLPDRKFLFQSLERHSEHHVTVYLKHFSFELSSLSQLKGVGCERSAATVSSSLPLSHTSQHSRPPVVLLTVLKLTVRALISCSASCPPLRISSCQFESSAVTHQGSWVFLNASVSMCWDASLCPSLSVFHFLCVCRRWTWH